MEPFNLSQDIKNNITMQAIITISRINNNPREGEKKYEHVL